MPISTPNDQKSVGWAGQKVGQLVKQYVISTTSPFDSDGVSFGLTLLTRVFTFQNPSVDPYEANSGSPPGWQTHEAAVT